MSPIAIPSRAAQPAETGQDRPAAAPEGCPDPSAEVRRVSIPLTQLPRGGRGTVNPDNLDAADFATLRAMGLRPNATVEVCRLGQHCIVALTGACGGGCRIGIARDLADRVMVEPAPAS